MIVAKEDDLPLRTAPPTQPRGVRPPSIRKLANQKRDCLAIFLTEKFTEKSFVACRNSSQMLAEKFEL